MSQVFYAAADLSPQQIDARIGFLDDDQIMEADFSGLHFTGQAEVNRFYDRLEERIAASGHDLWFFLVNYSDTRIDTNAWIAFARRGKTLNLAHSQGSVRFDASDITRLQIERDAGTESFDPNLFADRDAAIARLRTFPSRRARKIAHAPSHTIEEIRKRVRFLEDDQIMDVDFSNFTFNHSRDVNDFYDHIEEQIRATDRKWYFLVNYNDCQIMPQAWVQYARRGKALNLAASLGSVRYAAGSETEDEIRLRAQSQDFRPNIRNTRAEAIERINEMKSGAGQS